MESREIINQCIDTELGGILTMIVQKAEAVVSYASHQEYGHHETCQLYSLPQKCTCGISELATAIHAFRRK